MVNPARRRERLAGSRLYLVTDARRTDLDGFLDTVLRAGVDIVQLRDKEWEAAPLLAAAERFRAACDRHDALFVMNDRADLASAAGADGVHLGQDDLSPEAARVMLGPEAIIGRSTHDRAQMLRANEEPVDYVCVGPVYETPTKPGRPATGTALVAAAARECEKTWFAIGGIDGTTAPAVASAGAERFVVVRAVTRAADPAAPVKDLLEALRTSGAPDQVPLPSSFKA